MKPQAFFEEGRFIIELMLAIFPALFIAFKRKKRFYLFPILCLVVFGIAIVFPFLQDVILSAGSFTVTMLSHIAWYTFLSLCLFGIGVLTFEIHPNAMLLLTLTGFALQHIIYVIVNEVIYFKVWNDFLSNNLFVYGLLCVASMIICYTPYFYLCFKSKDKFMQIPKDKITAVIFSTIFLVTISIAFMSQHIFRLNSDQTTQALSAIIDIFASAIVVLISILFLFVVSFKKEKEMYSILYQKEKEQYDLFKSKNDLIDIKYHDLKYELRKLRDDGVLTENIYKNMKDQIKVHEAFINSGYDKLDVILTDFALKCQSQGIEFSPIVDGPILKPFPIEDIYALISNILENAFEYVKNLDEKYKFIRFTIKEVRGMIVIKETNYLKEELILDKEGLPLTTKKDKSLHGFGMKSVNNFAKTNGGNLHISTSNNEFELTILLNKKNNN